MIKLLLFPLQVVPVTSTRSFVDSGGHRSMNVTLIKPFDREKQ